MLRPGGSDRAWRAVRVRVLARDGWRCAVPACPGCGGGAQLTAHDDPAACPGQSCADRHATVDHVIERRAWPAGRPGRDDPSNLRAACRLGNALLAAARTTELRATTPSGLDPAGTSRSW